MRRITTIVIVGLLITASASSYAFDFESQGELALESRGFWPDDNANSQDYNGAIASRLQVDTKWRDLRAVARGFGRLDINDSARSTAILEEAWGEYKWRWLRLRLGFQMLNWTATEAFHPADVMNSRALDSTLENPEKFGELIAAVRAKFWNGNIEVMALPYVIYPKLPSAISRFNLAPSGIAIGDPVRLARDGSVVTHRWAPHWAAVIQQTIGRADIAIHALQHLERQIPLVYFDRQTAAPRPVYQPMTQIGLTYQHAVGGFMLKSEAAYRFYALPIGNPNQPLKLNLFPRDHAQVAGGAEYTHTHESGVDSTFILEGQVVIGYPEDRADAAAPLFDNDLLFGYRLAFNDENDKSLLLTAIVDVAAPKKFLINLSYAQRLGEAWRISAGLRVVRQPADAGAVPKAFEYLNDAHQLYGAITRYF